MNVLLSRYPRLGQAIPHVDLGVRETPVERWLVGDTTMLVKRDDLSSPTLGGNKVRALEWLLASLRGDQVLLTVGATGSTHALAVAEHGTRLGHATQVITWPQPVHRVAGLTASRLSSAASVTRSRSVAGAYLHAIARRLRGGKGVCWIPAGGSVPIGALGHVSAALELAEQLDRAGVTPPDELVVPLGSGGTAAGLLVGLSLAGLETRVVGVQVVPRMVASHRRVARLAAATRALLVRHLGPTIPPLDAGRLIVDRTAYGGAYGRETEESRLAAAELRARGGPLLDATYSAKAFAVALSRVRHSPPERVLFWLTFDGRWMDASAGRRFGLPVAQVDGDRPPTLG